MSTSLDSQPPLDLLDGARGESDWLEEHVRTIAVDASRPLEDRLAAYEDLVESEVGDTSLSRARNLERQTGLHQLYLKFEGGNPTGTQKDRIAFAQAADALRRGFDAITVATCGNYGAALRAAATAAGLRCVIFIPEGYKTRRLDEIAGPTVEIIRFPADYEKTVDASCRHAEEHGLYDANPGGSNTPLQLHAYGEIAYEIYDELRDAPAVVAVPMSNGTTLAGIHRGFVSLHRRGKTSRIPRIVGGSSHRKNPIVRAFVKGLENCTDLEPETIRETSVNEPLVNWHSKDGDAALTAIRQSGGWASDVSDRSMLTQARQLREEEGLSVLPASTAGLLALLHGHRKSALTADRYVAVLTGRRA